VQERDDILIGSLGNDVLHGGVGSDILLHSAGDGQDTITDFQNGDRLVLEGWAPGDAGPGLAGGSVPCSGGRVGCRCGTVGSGSGSDGGGSGLTGTNTDIGPTTTGDVGVTGSITVPDILWPPHVKRLLDYVS
jgi:Ca2+-binding RTX toxin-like protein